MLLFQIHGLIGDANRVVQTHLSSTHLLSAEEEFVINRTIAAATLVSYIAAHSDESARLHREAIHKEINAFKQIEELTPRSAYRLALLDKQKDALIKDVRYHQRDMALPANLPVLLLFGHHPPDIASELNRFAGNDLLADIMNADAMNERQAMGQWRDLNRRLSGWLLYGAAGSLVLTLIIGILFYAGIVERLRNIRANALGLISGQTLLPARGGADEVGFLDRQIYISAQRVRELQSYKEEMTSAIGKQFIAPLQAMDSTLSALRDNAQLTAKGKELADRANISLSRLLRLANQLLEMDKIQEATFELKIVPVDMQELVENACAAVQGLATQKNIEITRQVQPLLFDADSDRMAQVLINLLVNAVKFSAEGSAVAIDAWQQDDQVNIKVADRGRGIPKEFQDKLFERFAQASPADAQNNKGFGLGLSITKSIIDAHHGQIALASEAGRGTTWTITLPRTAQADARQIPQGKSTPSFSLLRWPILNANLRVKGLIVLGMPLLLQLLFVSVAAGSLHSANAQIDEAALARQFSVDASNLTRAEMRQGMLAFFYSLFKQPSLLNEYKSQKAAVDAKLDHLQRGALKESAKPAIEFAKGISTWCEQVISRPDSGISADKMVTLSGGAEDINRRCRELNVMFDHLRSKLDRFESEQAVQFDRIKTFLQNLIIICLISNSLLCVALGFFAWRSISQRVGAIADNAHRLMSGLPLVQPKEGNDEIAVIAKSVYLNGTKLRHLEEFKEQLIAVIGHDLRTPLTTLIGFFELLGSGTLGNLSPAQLELSEQSAEQARQLMTLIDEVIEVEKSKATAGTEVPCICA